MRKRSTVAESDNVGRKGIFAGDGSAPNYPALLLFLAGGVLGGFAVHDSLNHGSTYVAFLAAALLCAVVSLTLIIVKKGGKK